MKKLIEYMGKFNNTIVKRLGFLIEEAKINASADFMEKCLNIKSRGFAYLDPSFRIAVKK